MALLDKLRMFSDFSAICIVYCTNASNSYYFQLLALVRITILDHDDFQNVMGLPCVKIYFWLNCHEDRIIFSRDMSQILEKKFLSSKCHNVEKSTKNS